jgi:hypothetical protein
MFFKIIKAYFLRRKVKQMLLSYELTSNSDKIKTIGLFVDETFFSNTNELINEIKSLNSSFDIKILKYSSKKIENSEERNKTLKLNKVSFFGNIKHAETTEFVNTEFDLYLGFYDLHKPLFKMISIQSKAKFKVGINKINKKINHIVIQEKSENYKIITIELFKYLNILNKI